ncbi:MAG: hypothetical protein KBG28_08780 [Kofleriaceae bacterium]|jgi:tetratricopeptide (TPR) repeat protein|nr:hypothetical protein [Kofleriaceae bacterium]MBP6841104.1 hypothetical protein [Kofleriaceae bacterium]MBP9204042.1 hypothetical protein [Kofleriaceae bacterium]
MSDRPMHTQPGAMERLVHLYAEGERAVAEGRLADAEALFSEGLGIDDHFRQRYVTMYAQRAFVRQGRGDHVGAIRDYGQAIELEPPMNQAQYYFQRGVSFAELGGHEEHALADYGRSIALFDQHPGPFHLRGKLLLDQGRYPEAIADFDRMLALRPHPEVFQLRGYARLNLGDGRTAIGDLLASAQLAPDVYTDYLLAWAGAIAPDDELFFASMERVLRADASYKPYFTDNSDYARFAGHPRFVALLSLA